MSEFHFGLNLNIIRQAKGISQDAMAFSLNISQSAYSRLEARHTIPALHMVKRIAKVLDVEPSLLLSGRKLEDLIPKHGFEQQAKEIMNTGIGKKFFWMLVIPFINAAYEFANRLFHEFGASYDVQRIGRFSAGIVVIIIAYNWMTQMQKGKG